MHRKPQLVIFVLFVAMLVVPLCAHADWENGLSVSFNRMVNRWNDRLLWMSGINVALAFINIFLLSRSVTIINTILLALQFMHILIGFAKDSQSGWIAVGLFVFTIGHLILKRVFATK